MTKSSVDRKRSKYGEKYSLRFHKRLKTYDLTCNDETPHLIAKFVETDGDLAMRLFERLESNYKENEQLKNKIYVLEDDNETYHKSLETLNLYTKRFIPTKCTNEFKDCKTNRYYWLDHEGNFDGCLELLNLLDCENEVLKSENSQLKGRLMEYEEQIKSDDLYD